MKHITIILAFLVTLSSPVAAQDYEKKLQVWEEFAWANKLGDSEDYWLEKKVGGYGWSKVAIIVGYGSDWSACEVIRTELEEKYTSASFRCIPANKQATR